MMTMVVILSQLALQAQQDGIVKIVAGAVITNKENRVLLLRRKPHDFMPNIYELPSGQLEHGETIEQGLRREITEETALNVKTLCRYLGHFDYKSQSGKKTRQFNFHVTTDRVSDSDVKLTEHDDFVWCHQSQLDKFDITPQTKSVIERYFGSAS